MLRFKHTVEPDPEVLAILVTSTDFARQQDGRAQVRVDPRLEAPLAERTERTLKDLGGEWDRTASCIVLPAGVDPDRLVEKLLQDGSVTVSASLELSLD